MTLLVGKLGFKSTTHKHNLYSGLIDSVHILACQQIDNFAIASPNPAAIIKLVSHINDLVTTEYQGAGKNAPTSLLTLYNGLDVHQTCKHILLNMQT